MRAIKTFLFDRYWYYTNELWNTSSWNVRWINRSSPQSYQRSKLVPNHQLHFENLKTFYNIFGYIMPCVSLVFVSAVTTAQYPNIMLDAFVPNNRLFRSIFFNLNSVSSFFSPRAWSFGEVITLQTNSGKNFFSLYDTRSNGPCFSFNFHLSISSSKNHLPGTTEIVLSASFVPFFSNFEFGTLLNKTGPMQGSRVSEPPMFTLKLCSLVSRSRNLPRRPFKFFYSA